MEKLDVVQKRVEPLRVQSVRRRVAGQAEILAAIQELRATVDDVLAGPPMALRLGFPKDGKIDVDIAFPVARAVKRDGFCLKVLPALPMFSFTHVGPVVGGPDGTNLIDARRAFVEYVGSRDLLVGDDPERFIYHEGAETHGAQTERYVTEVQYPYHMPIWLSALDEGTRRLAGPEAARRVMEGSEGLAEALDGRRAATWVHGAIDRLDAEIADERARACVLNGCAHHYIVQSAMVMSAAWKDSGHDLRQLVAKIADEKLLGGQYWIDESGPEPLIMIRRRPANPDGYEKAATPAEKRAEACFCPLVRDALRSGERVSRSFCHCSGGWYAQEWAVVFGEAPEVRLVETMLEGKDACLFAVVIPRGRLSPVLCEPDARGTFPPPPGDVPPGPPV